MALKFQNFWVSALSAPAAAADGTIYIPTGDAANLPAIAAGNTIRLVLPVFDTATPPNEIDWEIVEATAVNTTTGALTVARGVEGTVAKPFAAGARIDLRLTAGALDTLGVPQSNFYGAALENYTDKTADIAVTGATTTIDLATTTSRLLRLAMGANTTLAFANVPAAGVTSITLVCTQDATGRRTLAFPAGTKSPGASLPVLSTAAAAEDWIEVVFHPAMANPRAFAIGKAVA
ncbi:exported hypothetical protein [Thiomonas sp. CB3]|nr:exported hypothetical protein [Thiomonas sp. CB3]